MPERKNPKEIDSLLRKLEDILDLYEDQGILYTEDITESFLLSCYNNLKDLQELVKILNVVEESDSGKEFRPTFISSCRTMTIEKLKPILNRIGVN